MDPPNQYDVSDLAHGLGMLSVGQKYRQNNILLFTSAIFIYSTYFREYENRLKEQEQECKTQLKKGHLNHRVCFSLLDSVLDATSTRTSEVVIYVYLSSTDNVCMQTCTRSVSSCTMLESSRIIRKLFRQVPRLRIFSSPTQRIDPTNFIYTYRA